MNDVVKEPALTNECRKHDRRSFEIKLPSGQSLEISRRDLELMKFCREQGWITLEHVACMFFPKSGYSDEAPYRQIQCLIQAGLMKIEECWDSQTYSVTRIGVNLLKRLKIIKDIPVLKKLDDSRLSSENFLTDVRIIFARELKIRSWVSKRCLNAQGSEYKDFDAMVVRKGGNYIIQAEFFLRGQKYYRKQFRQFRPRNRKGKDYLLYITGSTDSGEIKQKILKLACGLNSIYAVTLDDLIIANPLCFENSLGEKISFTRKGDSGLEMDY